MLFFIAMFNSSQTGFWTLKMKTAPCMLINKDNYLVIMWAYNLLNKMI